MKKMNMEIFIDDLGGGTARPLYDTDIGRVVLVAKPSGMKKVKSKKAKDGFAVNLMIPLFPPTLDFFRGVVETIEFGEKEGRNYAVFVVNSKEDTAGFAIG